MSLGRDERLRRVLVPVVPEQAQTRLVSPLCRVLSTRIEAEEPAGRLERAAGRLLLDVRLGGAEELAQIGALSVAEGRSGEGSFEAPVRE